MPQGTIKKLIADKGFGFIDENGATCSSTTAHLRAPPSRHFKWDKP